MWAAVTCLSILVISIVPPQKHRARPSWVCVGSLQPAAHVGRRAGVPTDAEQCGWRCCIPSGSQCGVCSEGTGTDFAEAISQFDAAWRKLRPNYTDADFADYRRARLDGMEAGNVGADMDVLEEDQPGLFVTTNMRATLTSQTEPE